jgi:hypothetical protein
MIAHNGFNDAHLAKMLDHVEVRTHGIHHHVLVVDVLPDVHHAVAEVRVAPMSRVALGGECYVVAEPALQPSWKPFGQVGAMMLNPLVHSVDRECDGATLEDTEFAPEQLRVGLSDGLGVGKVSNVGGCHRDEGLGEVCYVVSPRG